MWYFGAGALGKSVGVLTLVRAFWQHLLTEDGQDSDVSWCGEKSPGESPCKQKGKVSLGKLQIIPPNMRGWRKGLKGGDEVVQRWKPPCTPQKEGPEPGFGLGAQ